MTPMCKQGGFFKVLQAKEKWGADYGLLCPAQYILRRFRDNLRSQSLDLIGAKQPAFSTNHLADTHKTKH